MKKIIALISIFSVVFAFASCADKGGEEVTTAPAATQAATQAQTQVTEKGTQRPTLPPDRENADVGQIVKVDKENAFEIKLLLTEGMQNDTVAFGDEFKVIISTGEKDLSKLKLYCVSYIVKAAEAPEEYLFAADFTRSDEETIQASATVPASGYQPGIYTLLFTFDGEVDYRMAIEIVK